MILAPIKGISELISLVHVLWYGLLAGFGYLNLISVPTKEHTKKPGLEI